MSNSLREKPTEPSDTKAHPFRRALLRGLAIILPPLLTIVILVWVWNIVLVYVMVPVETVVSYPFVWYYQSQVIDTLPPEAEAKVIEDVYGVRQVVRFTHQGTNYVRIPSGQWIPQSVYDEVTHAPGYEKIATADDYYHRYVQIKHLKRRFVIPLFLCLFIIALYLLGKFMAAGVGRIVWNATEQNVLRRLPVIRHVYSSVKQVTDFVFSEQNIEYTRVVAVEYPRKGIWSIGFVTGESMLEIQEVAGEPVLSVLMPTSPMPATGFIVTVRKSEAVDLNLSIDQALQFIVSCGVVVPIHQHPRATAKEIAAAIEAQQEEQRSEALSGAKGL